MNGDDIKIIEQMSEDNYFRLSDLSEIRSMTEFLMRSTSNLHEIIREPIFNNVDREIVEQSYFEIVNDLISSTKELHISNLKNFVFSVIRKEKPVVDEEIFHLIDEYVHKMPLLFQITTEELLNIWNMSYTEPNTGIELTFSEWAELCRKD
ncbi:MAG: hypothetical protein NC343_04895 [Muribaculum sp.]|nr:hypothetical protein [Muribaculaceae bacterium]MCM1081069.1 hypothetical protein [Muribaculum sp.]